MRGNGVLCCCAEVVQERRRKALQTQTQTVSPSGPSLSGSAKSKPIRSSRRLSVSLPTLTTLTPLTPLTTLTTLTTLTPLTPLTQARKVPESSVIFPVDGYESGLPQCNDVMMTSLFLPPSGSCMFGGEMDHPLYYVAPVMELSETPLLPVYNFRVAGSDSRPRCVLCVH